MKEKLPLGQRAVKKIVPLHIGVIPKFVAQTWSLTVDGQVEKPLQFKWSDFLSLPKVVIVAGFHCVEGWSVLDNRWEGVAFKTITKMAVPKANAKHVFFTCGDGYTTSLLLADLLDDDVLLAYKLDDKLLEPTEGW